MNLWRSFRPSGLADAGRAAPGACRRGRLRPVRLRDGAQWSRIRLADRAHLEPWEPEHGAELGCAACGLAVAVGVFGAAVGGPQGPHAAVCDRGRRGVRRSADHRERHPRRAAVGVDRLLGGQLAHRRRGGDRGAGARDGPLRSARSGCIGWRRRCGRRTPRAGRCWRKSGSARRAC